MRSDRRSVPFLLLLAATLMLHSSSTSAATLAPGEEAASTGSGLTSGSGWRASSSSCATRISSSTARSSTCSDEMGGRERAPDHPVPDLCLHREPGRDRIRRHAGQPDPYPGGWRGPRVSRGGAALHHRGRRRRAGGMVWQLWPGIRGSGGNTDQIDYNALGAARRTERSATDLRYAGNFGELRGRAKREQPARQRTSRRLPVPQPVRDAGALEVYSDEFRTSICA